MKDVTVIGGGLAGVEAAWQAARLGAKVRLFEMRPVKQTPAHRTDKLAEIVCSNSLKSDEPGARIFLKKSFVRLVHMLEAAAATRVPAGAALAVDRWDSPTITSRWGTSLALNSFEKSHRFQMDIAIIATGPHSEALTAAVMKLT